MKRERILITRLDRRGSDVEILAGAGWTCLVDYAGKNEWLAPFGPTFFHDGVQSWINSADVRE